MLVTKATIGILGLNLLTINAVCPVFVQTTIAFAFKSIAALTEEWLNASAIFLISKSMSEFSIFCFFLSEAIRIAASEVRSVLRKIKEIF